MRFDTRDVKPDVWSIAALTAVTAVIVAFLLSRNRIAFPLISGIVCAYLTLVIVILVTAFIQQLQYNPYSYNTIYYAGFALFVLSALIAQIILQAEYGHSVTDLTGLVNIFGYLLETAKRYVILSGPLILVFSAALSWSNVILIRREGRNWYNYLGFGLSAALIGGWVLLFFSGVFISGSVWEVMRKDLALNLFACIYLYIECMIIGTIIASFIVTHYEPEKDKDFIIVLGCGLNEDGTPTPLLRGRVDRALRFYAEQLARTGKAPVLIPSGGQGPDEVISESASMKAYMLEQGIPEEHIITEENSAKTIENMRFSKEIIEGIKPDAKVIFSTTNYHVFRSGLMARRVKMRAVGIGARTKWYFWPNATVREFIGLLSEHRLKQALVLGGMILLYGTATVLFYTMGG